MSGWESIAAVFIAAGGFLWSIFRDKTADVEEISSRLAKLESEMTHVKTDVARLEKGQDDLETSLKDLSSKIHIVDVKLERVLAILEKNKGA
jgi:hypothetical protein